MTPGGRSKRGAALCGRPAFVEGEENRLLLTHARRWTAHKGRALDVGLLGNVLDLRRATDDRPPGSWPIGSAEHLVRVSRPGSDPAETPAAEELQATLDSFWRFLRGTGRMSSESADPADLVRELRRALSYLPTSAERDHRSPEGRLTEVGEGPGSEPSRSRSLQHLPERLERMVNAWNKLREQDRRQRLSESGFDVEIADPAGPLSRPVDPVASAGAARSAAFVQACLRLADWVGPRREVTSSGVLRPAVAREAYEDLDLFTWEKAHLASYRAMPDFSEDMWQEVRASSRPAGGRAPATASASTVSGRPARVPGSSRSPAPWPAAPTHARRPTPNGGGWA